MKKVIVIVLLIMVLSALLIGSGVCLADDSQTNYYYVDKGYELYVYSNANRESIIMQIPSTYAFEYVGAQDDFIKIKYNSYEGYITESEFNSYCKPVTSNWGTNPYFYSISLNSSDVTTERVALYKLDRTPYDDTLSKTSVTINKVYGYYHNETGYYFLVDTTTTVFGNTSTATGYIKASDTNYSSFSKDTITTSAGYAEEIKAVEQNPPSGDSDLTIEDPNGNGNPSQPATNNFERYLLIAVIAVLCVVIIILIFAPNKSRRKQ